MDLVHFIQINIYVVIKLFILFWYYSFNVYSICSNVPTFIFDIINQCFFSLFTQPDYRFSIVLIFYLKKYPLVFWISSSDFFCFVFDYYSNFYYFSLLTLYLICYLFCSLLRWKFKFLILDFSSLIYALKSVDFPLSTSFTATHKSNKQCSYFPSVSII